MHSMKHIFLPLLAGATLAHAASSPDWVVESPVEFIATGRFQIPSDGQDIVVVDKATGLARLGLKSGGGITWHDLPTGMAGITGFTTLRNGTIDSLAAASPAWNAIQSIPADGSPQTFTSPVVGPHALVRLATGHAASNIIEDAIALTRLDGEKMGAMDALGVSLFVTAISDLPEQAQFLAVSPSPATPVLVSVRANQLRVDLIDRAGTLSGGFPVGSAHAAGLHWAAAKKALLYSVATDGTDLFQHRLSNSNNGGWWQPTGVAQTTAHAMPDTVLTLDTVPWLDATEPNLDALVAVRLTGSPDVLRLYRVWDLPAPSLTESSTITMPVGHEFAGLVAAGEDFLLLSGPGGRVQSWRRFHQPAPGAPHEEIASGTLPAQRARAASPNIFVFSQDPFVSNNAVLTSSLNRLDWTRVTESGEFGELDLGPSAGLGALQPIDVNVPGGVPLGNQLLDSACVAGFGPAGGLMRPTMTFSPAPGTYAVLDAGQSFPVRLDTGLSPATIHYRVDDGTWNAYDPAAPPRLTTNAVLSAYAVHTGTGARSLLASGAYVFAAPPPASPAAAVDADGNGLSDAWERAFGIQNPNADDDGDGFNAITEQNYGTDPRDAGSNPGGTNPIATLGIVPGPPGHITLAWPVGLVGYILESCDDLVHWQPVEPQPMASPWSQPIAGTRMFFRLRKL